MSVALMFSRRAEDLSFGIIHLGNDAKSLSRSSKDLSFAIIHLGNNAKCDLGQ